MSKSRANAFDHYAPIGWKTGGCNPPPMVGTGRSSVESTPTTSRKLNGASTTTGGASSSKTSSPESHKEPAAAATGYATPLSNRRASIKSNTSQQQAAGTMSISELVDSGLTALGQ